MKSYAGVAKIVRFNWPWYAGALGATGLGILLVRNGIPGGRWAVCAVAGLFAADFWLLASLAVSHYVYDRSPISRGAWLDRIQPLTVRRAAVFHAGQDEASEAAAKAMPSAEIQAFDFHDPARKGTPSLERARALAKSKAVAAQLDKVPLGPEVLDLGLIVFAAHEIRQEAERILFFRELARVLAPGGRLLMVEHMRDGWNFLAYGPGAFHFLSRSTWGRSFAGAGLVVGHEQSLTPFVRVFELGKPQ